MRANTFLGKGIALILLLCSLSHSLSNPAAVYCEEMNRQFGGYEYTVETGAGSGQIGVCILPNAEQCDEWSFFNGKCGSEFSFCEQQGYSTHTVSEGIFEYAACVNESDPLLPAIPVQQLVNLGPMLFGSALNTPGGRLGEKGRMSSIYNASNFSYWDWRSPPSETVYASRNYAYFDDEKGWITPVKNQGRCGSCWAFSAIGSMEAKYEIEQNESRLNPDLSEQHEVSCDTDENEGCNGGWMDYAYDYIMHEGIVDERCFPYVALDVACSNRCADYASRFWTIGGYYSYATPLNTTVYNVSNSELMQMLVDNGPVAIAVDASDWRFYSSGVLNCTNMTIEEDLNHGVVLVGYNYSSSDEGSYWIIKNSWGSSWGEDGFIKVRFNCSGVGLEATYAENVTPPDFAPGVELAYPFPNRVLYDESVVLFNFTVYDRNYTNNTCDLLVNNAIVNSTYAENASETSLGHYIAFGGYEWSARCWENELGVIGFSENRSLHAVSLYTTPSKTPDPVYATPSYTFNCSNGELVVSVNSQGRGVSGLVVRLIEKMGFELSEKTAGSDGKAVFNITRDGVYEIYVPFSDNYYTEQIDAFELHLCPKAQAAAGNGELESRLQEPRQTSTQTQEEHAVNSVQNASEAAQENALLAAVEQQQTGETPTREEPRLELSARMGEATEKQYGEQATPASSQTLFEGMLVFWALVTGFLLFVLVAGYYFFEKTRE